MKKLLTKLLLSLLIVLFCLGNSITSNARQVRHEASDYGGDQTTTSSSGFDWNATINGYAENEAKGNVVRKAYSLSGTVVTVTRVICVGVALIMLLVLAIKYMTSAPSDRATVTKHAVVYVVGAVIMFASSGILGLIAKFAGGL